MSRYDFLLVLYKKTNLTLTDAVKLQEELNKKKLVKKWDRKRKKFVTLHPDQDPNATKKRKDESGNIISDKYKPKLYENWKKKVCIRAFMYDFEVWITHSLVLFQMKTSIPKSGEEDEDAPLTKFKK